MKIININDFINDNHFNCYNIKSDQIIFEECVKINCFYCKNYDQKWTCPPKIPNYNYKQIINEYKNINMVVYSENIDNNYDFVRNRSTVILHTTLLKIEKILWDNNYPLAISFIGGSCKLCKECSKDNCKNKGLSRIPVEALGINVVKTMENVGVEIKFPPMEKLLRCGMVMW